MPENQVENNDADRFDLYKDFVDSCRNEVKEIRQEYRRKWFGLIAIITIGSVSFGKIETAQDYVLAFVAQPMLGKIGFTIICVTALISTFSAINATLYGGSRVNYELAEDDELSHEFTKYFWNQPVGLLITALLTLLIANTLNLESISTSGSAGFLLIFAIVNYSNYKLADKTRSKKYISLIGAVLCLIALFTLLFQQFDTNIKGASIATGIIIAAYLLEYFYKKSEKKYSKTKKD